MTCITYLQRQDFMKHLATAVTYPLLVNLHGPREADFDWTEEWHNLAQIVYTVYHNQNDGGAAIQTKAQATEAAPRIARRMHELLLRELRVMDAELEDAAGDVLTQWLAATAADPLPYKPALQEKVKHQQATLDALHERAEELRTKYPTQHQLSVQEQGELQATYAQIAWLQDDIEADVKELNY